MEWLKVICNHVFQYRAFVKVHGVAAANISLRQRTCRRCCLICEVMAADGTAMPAIRNKCVIERGATIIRDPKCNVHLFDEALRGDGVKKGKRARV